MMKKLITLGLLILPFMSVSAAQYVGCNLGTNSLHMTDAKNRGGKTGYKVGATYGYKFEDGFIGEFEISHRKNRNRTIYTPVSKDSLGEVSTFKSHHGWAYMANVLYEVNQLATYQFTPYFGIGVGYAENTINRKVKFNEENLNSVKESDNGFAYQGIVGVKYPASDKVSIAMQYNYFVGRSHAKDHAFGLHLIRNF